MSSNVVNFTFGRARHYPAPSLDDGAARDGGQAALCCVVDGARRTRLNPANRSAVADSTLDKTILKEALAQEW
jgi:hypothetical protein